MMIGTNNVESAEQPGGDTEDTVDRLNEAPRCIWCSQFIYDSGWGGMCHTCAGQYLNELGFRLIA